MSYILNLLSFWEKKESLRSNDYFLEMMQRYKDLWEVAQLGSNVVCCPVTSSITIDDIRREILSMHILIPCGSPGEFVSMNGDKVVLNG
jgi:hypothetical protein